MLSVPIVDFLQYDGNNGVECLERLQEDVNNTWQLFGEDAEGITFRYRSSWMDDPNSGYGPEFGWYHQTAVLGSWFGKRNPISGVHYTIITNDDYVAGWAPLPTTP